MNESIEDEELIVSEILSADHFYYNAALPMKQLKFKWFFNEFISVVEWHHTTPLLSITFEQEFYADHRVVIF